MKPKEHNLIGTTVTLASVTLAMPVNAVETTGEPGSPSATTTIDGRYLPAPPRLSPDDIKKLQEAEAKMEANK